MESRVRKWGNSLGVRIPKSLADKIKLKEGELIDFQVTGDMILMRKKKKDLETLLSKITPENLHDEINTGKPVGNEIW
ncbi:AbrB/MazE/SpoVT family DNA-binding domain-containing protein [Shimazuella sp. AN120528]|uniref:AbrB/MazE/SpoVT family DNA-binding domain-containing protein n=1 Tax=Shimazuella soli TaxID=1892854 RepID=UPI001F0F7948|nr:AbrB/MazE/SpoVT family DNA-binding domain-containing protein [Shimazuella soli]MCH5583791.1 AbrB/MazE/SpoVT family DNA-binding domain-containing protein [Shimazuella soli]